MTAMRAGRESARSAATRRFAASRSASASKNEGCGVNCLATTYRRANQTRQPSPATRQ
jgi:hypothetical protein